MPEVAVLGWRGGIQLGLLLLAFPVQLWLSAGSSEGARVAELGGLASRMAGFGAGCWELMEWGARRLSLFLLLPRRGGSETVVEAVPEAKEDEKGHFASSTQPRTHRPSQVLFRVGQVMRHKKWGYRGVIVGWDLVTKAPEEWIAQMHPSDQPQWRQQPNYAVLVDTRDRLTPQMAYVVQDNIRVVESTRVYHPLVDHYFEAYDGARYASRPWHRSIYPQD